MSSASLVQVSIVASKFRAHPVLFPQDARPIRVTQRSLLASARCTSRPRYASTGLRVGRKSASTNEVRSIIRPCVPVQLAIRIRSMRCKVSGSASGERSSACCSDWSQSIFDDYVTNHSSGTDESSVDKRHKRCIVAEMHVFSCDQSCMVCCDQSTLEV